MRNCDRAKNIFRIYEADIRLNVKNTEPETKNIILIKQKACIAESVCLLF